MAYVNRSAVISQLEAARRSRLLVYVLADRPSVPEIPGFAIQMTTAPQVFFADQLRAMGRTQRLDLFLYTRGGATDSVWPLVSLLREYTEHLCVIVPFRAHSAGTMICLGADEVVLTEIAELSPIDPTTGSPFNPPDPRNPQGWLGVSVEDVAAYFRLAEDLAGIQREPGRLEVFKELTGKVHPLALGNVQRTLMLIRRLARQLLTLHLNQRRDRHRIERIVTALTQEFYTHLHAIGRTEAVSLLGNWVRPASPVELPLIQNLFDQYEQVLDLRSIFLLSAFLGQNVAPQPMSAIGGFIETTHRSYLHETSMDVSQRSNLPANFQVQVAPAQLANPIPLVPNLSRVYDYNINSVGWKVNTAGI